MTRQAARVVWLAALGLVLAGCGGGEKSRKEVDTKPFEAAIVEYLRVNSMGMKPEKFEDIQLKGNTATAKVRMATADDLYGMKPQWTFEFEKQGEGWVVTRAER